MSKQMIVENATGSASIQAFAVDKNSAQLLQSQLHKLGWPASTVVKGSVNDAIQWCQQHQAAVLLVDIDDVASPVNAVAQLLTFCDPSCRVIVLGSLHDIDLYRSLMALGVVDYLTKPVLLDLLNKSLSVAQQPNIEKPINRSGRTIAVTSVSGGLGVSTLVAALAQQLSGERRIPVSVVDFDRAKSDQPVLLGSNSGGNLNSVLNTPQMDVRLLERSMEEINDRLHLVFQTPDISAPANSVNVDHLFEFGSHLCQLSNLVLWDIPSSLPGGSLDVLQHAQVRIVLTEFSVSAARHTRALLQHIGDESEGQQLLLVATQAHGEKSAVDTDVFEQYIARKVDFVLPELTASARTSLIEGPLNLSNGGYKQTLNQLMDELTGRTESASSGRLKRLAQQFIRRRSA